MVQNKIVQMACKQCVSVPLSARQSALLKNDKKGGFTGYRPVSDISRVTGMIMQRNVVVRRRTVIRLLG